MLHQVVSEHWGALVEHVERDAIDLAMVDTGLAERCQVITPDLRAHGDSGKTPAGHPLPGYARDLRAVVEALELKDFLLAGWSLAGPLVLEYWQQFQGQGVESLVLVEMTPAPMSPEDWNQHRLKGYNLRGMHQTFAAISNDRQGFTGEFVNSMFFSGKADPQELAWMSAEALKTPTAAVLAIYSDYLLRDYTQVLPSISVPTLVINGQSPYLSYGAEQGAYVAAQIPAGKFMLFANSGHMPFWEEADRFNQALLDLAG